MADLVDFKLYKKIRLINEALSTLKERKTTYQEVTWALEMLVEDGNVNNSICDIGNAIINLRHTGKV